MADYFLALPLLEQMVGGMASVKAGSMFLCNTVRGDGILLIYSKGRSIKCEIERCVLWIFFLSEK
jgi:hypothetical protein